MYVTFIINSCFATTTFFDRHVDCIGHMQRLLDQRHRSHRPVHCAELHRLTYMVARTQCAEWMKAENNAKDLHSRGMWSNTIDTSDASLCLTYECKRLIILIQNITNSIKSNSEVWGTFSELMSTIGYYCLSVSYSMKQQRAFLVEFSEVFRARIGSSEQKSVDEYYSRVVDGVDTLVGNLLVLKEAQDASSQPNGVANHLCGECKSLIATVISKLSTDIQAVPASTSGADKRVQFEDSASLYTAPAPGTANLTPVVGCTVFVADKYMDQIRALLTKIA